MENPELMHVYRFPAFRKWDVSDDLPITAHYFESASRQPAAGLRRPRCCRNKMMEDPVFPIPTLWDELNSPLTHTAFYRAINKGHEKGKPGVLQRGREMKRKPARVCDVPLELLTPTLPLPKRNPKAVDEDLYKIPPELLQKSRRLQFKLFNFFSRVFGRRCVCY